MYCTLYQSAVASRPPAATNETLNHSFLWDVVAENEEEDGLASIPAEGRGTPTLENH